MSQLPRTKTIRLSTPKPTTGENLILGYTSPVIQFQGLHDVVRKINSDGEPRFNLYKRERPRNYKLRYTVH